MLKVLVLIFVFIPACIFLDNHFSIIEECFDYHMPLLEGINNNFEKSYLGCSKELSRYLEISETVGGKWVSQATFKTDFSSFINFELEKCQNASKHEFTKNTSSTHTKLKNCLKKAIRPPLKINSEPLVNTTEKPMTCLSRC